MAKCLSATVIALMAVLAVLVQATQPAQATFHCMRIHAVMGGFNGSDAVQYVELRMNLSGQSFVQNRKARFYDGSGTLKAEFTFPATATVGNAFTGDSILIATAEYNAASAGPGSGGSGGDADFVFTDAAFGGNTQGFNGGDPLHPVEFPDGKVTFAEGSENCTGPVDSVVDSVAYGSFSGTVDYGSPAPALPSPSDDQALRLNNLNPQPSDNSTEYSLEATASAAKTVASGDLASDLDTPRNNLRQVATLQADSDGDGWTDDKEAFITTDPLVACLTNGWPPDVNSNGIVGIDDVFFAASRFAATTGDPGYTQRVEIGSQNGSIQIDDVFAFASRFGQTCT